MWTVLDVFSRFVGRSMAVAMSEAVAMGDMQVSTEEMHQPSDRRRVT